MRIQTSANAMATLRTLPAGTPVVAVDADDRPVAVGTILGPDANGHDLSLTEFMAQARAHSKDVGNYAAFVSGGLGTLKSVAPGYAEPADQVTNVVGLLAGGLSLAQEWETGDNTDIAIAAFKVGATALELAAPLLPYGDTVKTVAKTSKWVASGLVMYRDGTAKPLPPSAA